MFESSVEFVNKSVAAKDDAASTTMKLKGEWLRNGVRNLALRND